MDQPSRTDESYYETHSHSGSLDPSHHFHPPSSHPHPHPTPNRPSYSGFHHESPQHGMFQQPSQQHAGFHQQNESQHLHEFSDFHDSALSHHSHEQQDRARVSTLPSNVPRAYGGSHPLAESQHSDGPQSGSHIEPHHHSYQNEPRRLSEALSQPSTGTRHVKTHHHNERPQHLDPQQNRQQSDHADNISHHSDMHHHHEKSRIHADSHQAGHKAHHHHHHHGERHHHGDMPHREHAHHRVPSASQLSHKSHSTVATSPSHVGSKSTASGARSFLRARSQVSGQVHSKDSLKESVSWSDEEHVQKRKKAQRTHKKTRTGNIFQLLWEKISRVLLSLQEMILSLTQSLGFETFIFLVVCLNTVILVAQTFTELEIRGEWYFMVLDSIFLSIYVLEAILKLIALGLEYFYDPWNNLDFFIMIMAVLDFVLLQIYSLSYSFYNHSLFRILKVFKSMRALRAIRVLRRLSILTSLHEVTGTLSESLPSITAILTLMFTCLFLFSVVLRALFQESDPKRFQNIFTTLFTLFTMLTLDDWSLIYIDNRAQGAWYIIPILMIYIIIQYFIFLNLVIAVLVDNFQMALLKGLEKVKLEQAARVHEKLLDDSLTNLNKADADAQMTEEALKTQLIERMFGNMTEKQRALHFQFLQLVAAVEQHQQKFRSQATVIDELVDTAFEAGDDDYGK
ncbi:cation channel sperm-associated protein 1 [Arvicanthis niloticus]|uniref:cation channel sperm-associated protein 1 n=1 Tax=Arvicanthis niloticus TaxID=61156 RepID=UPI0014872D66|nr:cation channel sperm-associated protein 1 [Arvicanthis niloticus]